MTDLVPDWQLQPHWKSQTSPQRPDHDHTKEINLQILVGGHGHRSVETNGGGRNAKAARKKREKAGETGEKTVGSWVVGGKDERAWRGEEIR